MTAQLSTKQKTGQIHLNETILVVFVVLLIIFIGIFLFYRYSLASIEDTANTLSEQDATVLLAAFPNLAELRCHHTTCLDTAKFIPFMTLVRNHQLFYAQLLGKKTIRIEQLYPEPTSEDVCSLRHYQQIAYPLNCKSWTLYDNKPPQYTSKPVISTIVSLYFPETHTYHIGRMIIEVYR